MLNKILSLFKRDINQSKKIEMHLRMQGQCGEFSYQDYVLVQDMDFSEKDVIVGQVLKLLEKDAHQLKVFSENEVMEILHSNGFFSGINPASSHFKSDKEQEQMNAVQLAEYYKKKFSSIDDSFSSGTLIFRYKGNDPSNPSMGERDGFLKVIVIFSGAHAMVVDTKQMLAEKFFEYPSSYAYHLILKD